MSLLAAGLKTIMNNDEAWETIVADRLIASSMLNHPVFSLPRLGTT